MEYEPVTIKPNVKKIFILNIMKILLILMVIVIIIIVIDIAVIFDVLTEILKIFNLNIDSNQIVLSLIILSIIFSLTALIINYLNVSSLGYEIQFDKIIYESNTMFIFKNAMEINFRNVVRIYFST